jgi:ketosteroid isomerase-like protein
MMQQAHFALSFAADKVVVARSGDIAYETGTYSMTLSDTKKKAATEKGHYVVVWQKQSDGSWKVVRDVPVSDPPEDARKP